MPAGLILLFITYPLVVHLAIYFGEPVFAIYLLAYLLLAPLLYKLWRRESLTLSALPLVVVAMALLYFSEQYAGQLIQLPPILIYTVLAAIFGSTLLPGQRPLTTRLAQCIKGDISDREANYSRGVTLAWTLLFALLALTAFMLGHRGDLMAWSLFTNAISYLIIAAMFVIEYFVRRWWLPGEVAYSLPDFLRRLVRVDYRQLLKS
ncbi:MAG: hypothetical protein GY696_09195 [Gammaproteobacteria bacterium]|nr:hypothetical protein [Gammaproteobacteria bacterium]